MKKVHYFICTLTLALAFIYSCDKKIGLLPKESLITTPPITGSACDSIKYSVDIQPILTANCASCHPANSKGDFTNYVGTKVKVTDGTFVTRVLVNKDMPPFGALSATDRSKIQCWIDNGSPNN